MTNQNISSVDITIGANMYGRIPDLPNTPSHVLAEFVDNALQSSRDKKEKLLAVDSEYRLRIDIDFEWDGNTNQATAIIITQAELMLQTTPKHSNLPIPQKTMRD